MASPNPGKQAAALAKVREAIDRLQKAVPDIDPSSALGKAVIKAIGDLSKNAPPTQAQPGAGLQSARDQLMAALQGGPLASLQRSMAAQPQGAPAATPSPAPAM